ncbi:MAG: hypothetical protein ABIO04_07155 [Ferruginibacter sp.]
MRTSEIALAGIAGTTAFTLFSYIVSQTKKKNFKEPELLGDLFVPSEKTDKNLSKLSGWGIHYLAGLGFAAAYSMLINNKVKPTLINGTITGAVSGLAAIGIWHAMLTLHPDPPKKPNKQYYGHLFLGHVIFGAFSFLTFGSFNKKTGKKRKALNSDAITD